MLKLMKYEFRKNRTGLGVMLGFALGMYLVALIGGMLDQYGLIAISVVALFFYAFAAYVYVLVRGISAYSGELRGRTGYLLMMVPRSTMSILFGKLLFTLFFALLMLAATVLALMGAGSILVAELYELDGVANAMYMLDLMRTTFAELGFDPMLIVYTSVYFVGEILSSVLMIVSIAYLAVTLSATVLESGKLRGLISFVFFAALFALVTYLTNLVVPEASFYETYAEAMRATLPSLGMHLAVTCLFTALSAVLLKERVSL